MQVTNYRFRGRGWTTAWNQAEGENPQDFRKPTKDFVAFLIVLAIILFLSALGA